MQSPVEQANAPHESAYIIAPQSLPTPRAAFSHNKVGMKDPRNLPESAGPFVWGPRGGLANSDQIFHPELPAKGRKTHLRAKAQFDNCTFCAWRHYLCSVFVTKRPFFFSEARSSSETSTGEPLSSESHWGKPKVPPFWGVPLAPPRQLQPPKCKLTGALS